MIKCKVTNTTEGPVFFRWVKPAINLEAKASIVVDYDPFTIVDRKTKPVLMSDLNLKRCALEYQIDLSQMSGLPVTLSVVAPEPHMETEEKKAEEPKAEEPKAEDKKAEEPDNPFKEGGIQEGSIEDAKPEAKPLLGDWGGATPTRKDVPVVDIWDGKTEEEKKAEDKKAEEPKAEEPKAEEPKAEEPKAEEPKAEEPKAEDKKAEGKKSKKKKKAAAKKNKPELFGDTDDSGDTLL